MGLLAQPVQLGPCLAAWGAKGDIAVLSSFGKRKKVALGLGISPRWLFGG